MRETVLHVGRQIDDFAAHTWYETVDAADHRSSQGLMDLSEVPLPEDVQVFTCGPLPFMRHVHATLVARGVPAARIRYEVFGPDLWGAGTARTSPRMSCPALPWGSPHASRVPAQCLTGGMTAPMRPDLSSRCSTVLMTHAS